MATAAPNPPLSLHGDQGVASFFQPTHLSHCRLMLACRLLLFLFHTKLLNHTSNKWSKLTWFHISTDNDQVLEAGHSCYYGYMYFISKTHLSFQPYANKMVLNESSVNVSTESEVIRSQRPTHHHHWHAHVGPKFCEVKRQLGCRKLTCWVHNMVVELCMGCFPQGGKRVRGCWRGLVFPMILTGHMWVCSPQNLFKDVKLP